MVGRVRQPVSASSIQYIHFKVVTRRYDESHCPRKLHQENSRCCLDTCTARGEVDPSSGALESLWATPTQGPHLFDQRHARQKWIKSPAFHKRHDLKPTIDSSSRLFFLLLLRPTIIDSAASVFVMVLTSTGHNSNVLSTARFMPQPLVNNQFVFTEATQRYHGLAQ